MLLKQIVLVFILVFLIEKSTIAQRIYVGIDVYHKHEQLRYNDVGGYILKNDRNPTLLYLAYGVNFGYQIHPQFTLETGIYRNTLANRVNYINSIFRTYSNSQGAFQFPLRVKWLVFRWGRRERFRIEAIGGLAFSIVNRKTGPMGRGSFTVQNLSTSTTLINSSHEYSLLRANFWSSELGGSINQEMGKRRRLVLMASYTYQWGLGGTIKHTNVEYIVNNVNYQATIDAKGSGHFYAIGLKYLLRRKEPVVIERKF